MNRSVDVLVVGSLNRDLVAEVSRRPEAGETVVAERRSGGNGGKGGNQAVAAAAAGARTAMVGAVGADPAGDRQLQELRTRAVDTASIIRSEEVETSLAMIVVTPDGENSIVVVPGANDLLDEERVRSLCAGWTPAVVLAQSEIGSDGCGAAARFAAHIGARLVFSDGPVVALDDWSACDPIVVNLHEARDLLRLHGEHTPPEDPRALARTALEAIGARSIVLTLGGDGSVVGPLSPQEALDGQEYAVIAAQDVEDVVDTTGAGDVYAGTLAARLALGDSMLSACRAASRSAAHSVRHPGARP